MQRPPRQRPRPAPPNRADETHTEDARCTFSTISAPTSSPIAAARRLLLPAGAASDASTGWHAHTLAHTLGKRREVPEDSCTVEGPAWKRHASRGSAFLGSAAAAAVGEGEGEEDEEEDDAVSRLGQAPLLTHPPPALPRLRAPAAPPAASPPPPPQGEAMCEDAASPPSSSDNDDGFWGPFIPAGGLRGPLDFEE
jgi:hypothetical protein